MDTQSCRCIQVYYFKNIFTDLKGRASERRVGERGKVGREREIGEIGRERGKREGERRERERDWRERGRGEGGREVRRVSLLFHSLHGC